MAVHQYLHSRREVIGKTGRCTGNAGRALRFEQLESRQMLATITVTSLADNLAADGQVTLREAIRAAELNISVDGSASGSGADTVEFHPSLSGSIELLTSDDAFEGASALLITTAVTIRGNAEGITIARSRAAPEMRLFRVAETGTLSLESLTLTGGIARGRAGTAAEPDGGDGRGGAVLNEGTLEVAACTFYGNETHGGVAFAGGLGGAGRGGAIANIGGVATIYNATLSDNGAHSSDGSLQTGAFGGAVYTHNGDLFIRHSTIVGQAGIAGRGVYVLSNRPDGPVEFELFHSIVGYDGPLDGHFTEAVVTTDNGGMVTTSTGFNLIRRSVGFSNGSLSNAPPMIGLLSDNGGPTWTRAPLAGSPAIDAGDAAAIAGVDGVPPFDQRGASFSRVVDGDAGGGPRIDIGAFELQGDGSTPLSGDYNGDGSVNAADYTVWRDQLGRVVTAFAGADGDGSAVVDAGDYSLWRSNFGNASATASMVSASRVERPGDREEPATVALLEHEALVVTCDFLESREFRLVRSTSNVHSESSSLQRERLVELLFRLAHRELEPRSATTGSHSYDPDGTDTHVDRQLSDTLWAEWAPRLELF